MIIWGSGTGGANLGLIEHRACSTCERDRPFNLFLQYRYAHVYFLRWVTKKQYHLACQVCRSGWELDAKEVEPKLTENPIPFMTRYGWTFLVGLAAFLVLAVALAD